ncbi:MAG: hypothetical protein IKZ82_13090 [Clostridia bacterium]|nr:hypothetical protein [Clostridia bacterium]
MPLGTNAAFLSSSADSTPVYRIVRIVCQYGEKTVEYCAVFDGWISNGK